MRRLPALMLALTLAGWAAAAAAQGPLVTSAAPESVALTIYRAPDRGADQPIDVQADDQRGYALVTETRTVSIPEGLATLRFEGVAGNIFAETAILTGLPDGVTERNLDADLLSPRTLYDRALGRRVIVRRTDPATGRVREEQATIRSGAGGAAVLQVAGGFEGLRCSGLPETIVQTGLPDGLVARPTLSIRTESKRATRATITLSYLAGGFDWQADYVLSVRPDAAGAWRGDLFAWVTLASSDVTPFAAAATSVIAGKPKREARSLPKIGQEDGGLQLRCWPTEIRYGRSSAMVMPPPMVAMAPPPAPMMDAEAIVVTGSRRLAKQEDLGDLKLYRLPEPTDVAPRSQKQVAMLVRDDLPLDLLYIGAVNGEDADDPVLTITTRNLAGRGLGVPLPAGSVAVFEGGTRPMLIGQSSLEDRAVGEDVEITLGESSEVVAEVEAIDQGRRRTRYRLTVTNALPRAVAYQARIALADGRWISSSARFGRRGEARTWSVTVPPNASATLDYTIRAR